MAFNLTLIDERSRTVHKYNRVPSDAVEAIHTLLARCCHGDFETLSIEEYKSKIIIHPWKLGGEEFPYDIPYANIYLDGKLESMNGYDLCGIENFPNIQSPTDGYECDVLLDDKIVKSRLFLWNEFHSDKWKGLVVAEDDEVFLASAKEKCRLKLSVI